MKITARSVANNVAVGSEVGFFILGEHHVFSGNFASRNRAAGFYVNFGPHTFTGNSAIGNVGPGIWIGVSWGTVITRNNIYGNDVSANCGLLNSTNGTVDAHGNFWGAASAPGDDPANEACDEGSSHTITSPIRAARVPCERRERAVMPAAAIALTFSRSGLS